MQKEFPTPFTYLLFEKEKYFGIALKDNKLTIAAVPKDSAIGWKTNKQDDKISLEFLIEGKPIYLAWENKQAALQKDPFYFQFSLMEEVVMFSYQNKVAFAYLVEPAESETNRVPKSPQEKSQIWQIAKEVGHLTMVFAFSEIALNLLKKLYTYVKGLIFKDAMAEKIGVELESSLQKAEVNALTEKSTVAEGAEVAEGEAAAEGELDVVGEEVAEGLMFI